MKKYMYVCNENLTDEDMELIKNDKRFIIDEGYIFFSSKDENILIKEYRNKGEGISCNISDFSYSLNELIEEMVTTDITCTNYEDIEEWAMDNMSSLLKKQDVFKRMNKTKQPLKMLRKIIKEQIEIYRDFKIGTEF